jgi:hypothetical protein
MKTPRFVIDTGNSKTTTVTKSKYVDLSKSEKLQAFLEFACYSNDPEEVLYIDASNEKNRKRANAWLETELRFLSSRDEEELKELWQLAITNGFYTRTLFSYIKQLQEKYGVV